MSRHTDEIFAHIHERMGRAYERVLGTPGAPGFCSPYMEPPTDVYETNDEVIVLIEIAGAVAETLEIEVDGSSLVFRGERRPLKGRPKRVYSQMEISHGVFQRELSLPATVTPDGAKAVYTDGILEISLPKAKPTTRRRLWLLTQQ